MLMGKLIFDYQGLFFSLRNFNDVFRTMVFGNIKSFRLTIYNRWGEIEYETSERNKGWDGTYRQKTQDINVFIWTCHYQLEGEKEKVKKGTVVLIR
jgi:gliding motility-associated-like protein